VTILSNTVRMTRTPTAVILFLLLASRAFAASDTDIGSENQRLRRPPVLDVPRRPMIPVELPPEGELPPAAADATPIPVTRVAVEGATLMPEPAQRSITATLEGRTATLQELRNAARDITRWYRGHGYVTSRALVPAQSVDGGIVRVRVLEGKLGRIRFEGQRYISEPRLRRSVEIQPGQILRMAELERTLAALNRHTDRTVRLVLAPGTAPETTDLIFQVTDRLPVHASYGVDTLGTKTTGQVRQSVRVAHRNLTGHDDELSAFGIVSEFGGLRGGTLGYTRPLTASGVAASFDVSAIQSSVGGNLKSLLAHGSAVTLSPGLVIPLIQRSQWELQSSFGLDLSRVRTRQDEVITSKDDLRVLRMGSEWLGQDRWGRSWLSPELRVGLGNFLGGSHGEDLAASRSGAGGSFVRFEAHAIRVQQGPWGTSVIGRAGGQLTSDRLVPAEQFRIGGLESVRGYAEGEYLADTGFTLSVEGRVPVGTYLPEFPNEALAIGRARRSFLALGFWDYGEGFLRGPRAGEDADARLVGTGFGFQLRPTTESLLRLDLGWPVGDPDADKDHPHIHLLGQFGF